MELEVGLRRLGNVADFADFDGESSTLCGPNKSISILFHAFRLMVRCTLLC